MLITDLNQGITLRMMRYTFVTKGLIYWHNEPFQITASNTIFILVCMDNMSLIFEIQEVVVK